MSSSQKPDAPVIMVLLNQLVPGGAELRTLELLAQFKDAHFDIVTICPDSGPLTKDALEAGHSVFSLRHSAVGVLDFWKLLRRRRPHVVHSQLGIASGVFMVLAAIQGIPTRIAHLRSDGIGGNPTFLRSVKLGISKFLTRVFATSILGVSPSTLDHGWGPSWNTSKKFDVYPNFIDVSRMAKNTGLFAEVLADPTVSTGTRIANIGRAEPAKRRGLTIEIWERFAQDVDSSLFLIGTLNDSDKQKYEASLERGGQVHHVAYAPNAGSVLRHMDVLLTTSEREGLPGVVLEALASGTPVVSADLPGAVWISEQISGVTLVPVDGEIGEWVNALQEATLEDGSEIMASFAKSQFAGEMLLKRYRKLWRLGL